MSGIESPLFLTPKRLQLVRSQALDRIFAAGLATEIPAATRVRLGALPSALGEYWFDTETIWMPAFSPYRALTGRDTVETLIHEYGHAVASAKLSSGSSKRLFYREFGRKFAQDNPVAYDVESHVSPYAAVDAMEDFAETYLAVVKNGRNRPEGVSSRILRKMAFVVVLAK